MSRVDKHLKKITALSGSSDCVSYLLTQKILLR